MTEKELRLLLHKHLKKDLESYHYSVTETENDEEETPKVVEIDGYVDLIKVAANIIADLKANNNG